jgi:hypothetical protein
MESFQNTNIKRIFGFPKRFHHTKLLLALDIKGIGAQIHSFKLSLYNRVFKVDSISIARDFNFIILLAKFISDDATVEGIMLLSVHTGGFSPSLVALNKTPPMVLPPTGRGHDGVADSFSTLLYGNLNNKGSRERRLILRAF